MLVKAQDTVKTKRAVHEGLIRATATITPSWFIVDNVEAVYVHGVLEYYLDENISLRGDGFYFLDIISKYTNSLTRNHSLHAGPSFHFKTNSAFDPYLSIQPGIGFSEDSRTYCYVIYTGTSPSLNCHKATTASSNPLASVTLGFNYFATKWFHFFGETRYTYGIHLAPILYGSIPLSELKFSFGLGFNVR